MTDLSEGDRRLVRRLVDEARRRPDDETPSALAIAGRAAPWVDADRPEPVIEFIRTLGGEAEECDATDDASANLEAWA
jgi:hypothetical protein